MKVMRSVIIDAPIDRVWQHQAELEEIVGNGIYRDAQIALSNYLQDTTHD